MSSSYFGITPLKFRSAGFPQYGFKCGFRCDLHTVNLLFLTIEQLIAENKIKIRRGEWDYIISVYDTAYDTTVEKKINLIQPSKA